MKKVIIASAVGFALLIGAFAFAQDTVVIIRDNNNPTFAQQLQQAQTVEEKKDIERRRREMEIRCDDIERQISRGAGGYGIQRSYRDCVRQLQ